MIQRRKVLIANRGEIAVRIVRACRELGFGTVAVFSEVDRGALHVALADEAYAIGPPAASESYLRIDKLLDIAHRAGVWAIHPGYGFLAENAHFAQACADAGIAFVGPSALAIALMGDKVAARAEAHAAGVPCVPGGLDPIRDTDDLHQRADETGYPLLLKAAAGGGGKGIRVVHNPSELVSAFERASSEARSAFGDDRVYIESFIDSARHVEVQVLADHHGNVVHLGERDCSMQRRNQKLVEETPAPSISEDLRAQLCAAAVALCKRIGYTNAGTVEYLVTDATTPHARFYFMEMNTRLQVEHPVSEMVTGIDVVREQLQIAAGEPLSFSQADVQPRGAAIEVRLYAEDPHNGFLPSTGTVAGLAFPAGPFTRVDSALRMHETVSAYYDPLIAKICSWGSTRTQAIERLVRVLSETRIDGLKTCLPLLRDLIASAAFAEAGFSTRFLESYLERWCEETEGATTDAVIAATVHALRNQANTAAKPAAQTTAACSGGGDWQRLGRAMALRSGSGLRS